MKKLLLMCCVLMGISAVSYAQGGGRRSPEERAKQLQTQLKLSDDQTAKVTDVYKAQAVKMDSLRKTANGDMSNMREAMRPISTTSNAQIKALLKPDQATIFDSLSKRRGNRGGGGGGGQN